MKLSQIAKEFVAIGLTTFGGGSAVVPVVHQHFIDKHQAIDEEDFLQIVTISNLLPGPSMIETAAGVGYKLAQIKGAIVASIAISLPAMLLFIFVMYFFNKFISIGQIAPIITPTNIIIAASMFILSYNMIDVKKLDLTQLIIIIATVVAITTFNISTIIVLLVAMLIIVIKYFITK